MRTLTFKCVITSTMVSFIDLQGQHIPLSQNGTTWTGSAAVLLDDKVNIAIRVTGITDSSWSVAVTTPCPAGTDPAKILTCSGTIPPGGALQFSTSVTVAPNPCTAKPAAGADKAGCPPVNTALEVADVVKLSRKKKGAKKAPLKKAKNT